MEIRKQCPGRVSFWELLLLPFQRREVKKKHPFCALQGCLHRAQKSGKQVPLGSWAHFLVQCNFKEDEISPKEKVLILQQENNQEDAIDP